MLPLTPPTLLVTSVGFRPAAIAAVVRAWELAFGDSELRLLLLPTSKTAVLSDRVRTWLARAHPWVSPEQRGVSPEPYGEGSLHQTLTDIRLQRAAPLAFFADPGLKTPALAALGALGPEDVVLHLDADGLYAAGQPGYLSTYPELGVGNLLALHELNLVEEERQVCGRATSGGWLASGGDRILQLDVLYERRGELFGVICLPHGVSLNEVRAIKARARDERLRGLRPHLAICSVDARVRRRARRMSLPAFSCTRGTAVMRQRWLQGANEARPPRPGGVHSLRDGKLTLEELPKGAVKTPHPSQDLEDCTLVVQLGTDPAATLVSIASHRPARAVILYDRRSPVVRERAARLIKAVECGRLPVGELRLAATTHDGKSLVDAVPELTTAGVRVDLTPGTTRNSTLLARAAPPEALWTLDLRGQRAARLDDTDQRRLAGPSVLAAALVGAGPVLDEGRTPDRALDPYHRALGHLIVALPRSEQAALAELLLNGGAATWSGTVVQVAQSEVSLRPPGGEWLFGPHPTSLGLLVEDIIGSACWPAADEVRVGLKLGRIMPSGRREVSDEVDVMVRRGGQLFAISCKAPTGVSWRPEKTRAALREIQGVATFFGRLAIPMLVRLGGESGLSAGGVWQPTIHQFLKDGGAADVFDQAVKGVRQRAAS